MKVLPHRWIISSMGDEDGWDNNEEYCCCCGDLPLGPQSQRFRLFLSFDVRLQLSGFHRSAQPQVKHLHSLKCWKKVLFVVLNRFRCSSNLDVPMNRINMFSYLGHWHITQFHLSRKRTETKAQVCLLCRFLSVCVVVGLGLLHVSDSAVDRHLLQAPRQPHPALLRMGARHHCYGHQQVCVCLVFWRTKDSCPESAPPSVWFARWLIP